MNMQMRALGGKALKVWREYTEYLGLALLLVPVIELYRLTKENLANWITCDAKGNPIVSDSLISILTGLILSSTFLAFLALRGYRKARKARPDLQRIVQVQEKTLNGTKAAAQKIAEQTYKFEEKPPYAFAKATYQYWINRNGDGEVEAECHIGAVDRPLHFWKIYIGVEPEAPPFYYLDEIGFKVEDLGGNEVRYLEGESDGRKKVISIFFLPQIDPREEPRIIKYKYKWPGMLRKLLKKGAETFSATIDSRGTVGELSFSYLFEPEIGKILYEQKGAPIRGVRPTDFQGERGWGGWRYSLLNAPADKSAYEFTMKLGKGGT